MSKDPRTLPENSGINKIQRNRINANYQGGRGLEGAQPCPAGQTMINGLCRENTYRQRNEMVYETRESDMSDPSTKYNVRATSVRDYTCPSGWKILDKATMQFTCDNDYIYSGNNNPIIKSTTESNPNPKSTSEMLKSSNTAGYRKK
jgi:hypothetical protein